MGGGWGWRIEVGRVEGGGASSPSQAPSVPTPREEQKPPAQPQPQLHRQVGECPGSGPSRETTAQPPRVSWVPPGPDSQKPCGTGHIALM